MNMVPLLTPSLNYLVRTDSINGGPREVQCNFEKSPTEQLEPAKANYMRRKTFEKLLNEKHFSEMDVHGVKLDLIAKITVLAKNANLDTNIILEEKLSDR